MNWRKHINPKSGGRHKYDYGHVVVYGGRMTGAASLASVAALRMGAGLVTIVSRKETASVYRNFCPSLIVEEMDEPTRFDRHLHDDRRNAVLIGPGAGKAQKDELKKAVTDAVVSGKICVIDADALTIFENSAKDLVSFTHGDCVLTPHEGEFAKIFPDLSGDKGFMASTAAKRAKAIVVLKGSETVVASPDGRTEKFANGSAWLASAGTGDVLAGMIAGLGAWHKDHLFEAACAAVWMHGEASQIAGPGLISADLLDLIPEVWPKILVDRIVAPKISMRRFRELDDFRKN